MPRRRVCDEVALKNHWESLRRRLYVLEALDRLEMKFSHSIQFNAVPEWQSHYLAYSNLKKLIFTLEKEVNQATPEHYTDAEASPLLSNPNDDPDHVFSQALDRELERITSFYELKEPEIFAEVDELLRDDEDFKTNHENWEEAVDGHQGKRRMSIFGERRKSLFQDRTRKRGLSVRSRPTDEDDSEEDDEISPIFQRVNTADGARSEPTASDENATAGRKPSGIPEEFSDQALSIAFNAGATLKKRMISLYVSLNELKSFIQLNRTGFGKVLKKYDKVLDRNLRQKYISTHVDPLYTFKEGTNEKINDRIAQIEQAFATLNTQGNVEQARRELRLDLREHVVWERNTVWREMIGIERKAQAANLGVRQTMLGASEAPRQGDEQKSPASKGQKSSFGRHRVPDFLMNSTIYVLTVAIAVFIVLLMVPIMDLPEQQNCLALVVFVSILWATEVRLCASQDHEADLI